MSVGRNELCPCGSGKKYKKCCGVVTPIHELRDLREQRMKKETSAWVDRLRRFVEAHVTDGELEAAKAQFANEVGLSEADQLSPQWSTHFYNWLVFDRPFEGETWLDRFLRKDGRKMEPEVKASFHRLILDMYVIESVDHDQVTVRELAGDERHVVADIKGVEVVPGQVLIGRLLSMGQRSLLFSGSLVLMPQAANDLLPFAKEDRRAYVTRLYRFIVHAGKAGAEKPAQGLVRRVYKHDPAETEKRLQANSAFELKKRDAERAIWVFAKTKKEFLLPTLFHALLELHEVSGEVIVTEEQIVIESFAAQSDEIALALELGDCLEEQEITTLTSTQTMLTKGTVFITSQPTLPPKLLQWAVQTYFTENWLASEQPELGGMEPILIAASDNVEFKQRLEEVVEQLEQEAEIGQGAGRLMRVESIRPRLSLPNHQLHVNNLLKRPLIEGLPESVYTVQPHILEDIAVFVREMTEGKSEATLKKYDEVMSQFRTFIRSAYGPRFAWENIRPEEVAYFLAHDVLVRAESVSKTLAANHLSVLTAFFKWLDKRYQTVLYASMQTLLAELKDTLPEAYRIRQQLQKEALLNLAETGNQVQTVLEETVVLREQAGEGWYVTRQNGEKLLLTLNTDGLDLLDRNWSLLVLAGVDGKGTWRLYGQPEVYPPIISQLLGADVQLPV